MLNCIFCKIVKGEEPASVVYENQDVLALLTINPIQQGHTLVIPKKHFVDIWDIEPNVLMKLIEAIKEVARRLQEAMGSEEIITFSQSGKPAGSTIYHFHMHVVPITRGKRTKFAEWWKTAEGHAEKSELDRLAKRLHF